MLFVVPRNDWEHAKFDKAYPIIVEHHLCDLNHVPDKSGATTFGVVCSQISRLGIFSGDVVAGSSDGGGENMGVEGVHGRFTEQSDSYVRRRCMSHISWRVTDAGIAEMMEDTWYLPAYLRDGVSWSRICAIACQPVEGGGLALLQEYSVAYQKFSLPSPPSVLEGRPETNFLFLQWLLPRQALLAKIVPRDVQQRELTGRAAQVSARTLSSPLANFLRWIDVVMIQKGRFLFHLNKTLHCIVREYTYDGLMEKASHIIMSLEANKHVLDALNIDEAHIDPAETSEGWIAFMMSKYANGVDFQEEAMTYHGQIALRMSGHLRLTWENMNTSVWVSGGILSMDPCIGRTSGRVFQQILLTKRPDERSPYEKTWVANDALMKELEAFNNQEPPSLVWRANGKFALLFEFLAPRFLGCGDTVLDVESIHARWKWISETSRAMRFRMLNCNLRLKMRLERFGGSFGDEDDHFYHTHFRNVAEASRAIWNDVEKNADLGERMKSAYIWQHRYNVSPLMINLIKERGDTPNDQVTHQDESAVSWGQYLRWLFLPGHAYNFSRLGNVFVYIGTNQSLPNRDRKHVTEAIGRSLSIAFFTPKDEIAEGKVLEPTEKGTQGDTDLVVTNRTTAEISLASGYFPTLPSNHTAREAELDHEANMLRHDVIMWDVKREGPGNWNLVASNPRLMEDDFMEKVAVADMKKIGLARQIQLREGLSDNDRNNLLKYSKPALLARLGRNSKATLLARLGWKMRVMCKSSIIAWSVGLQPRT